MSSSHASKEKIQPILRCGIVGCGYIADIYMEALRGISEVSMTAICDTDTERLAAFGARYNVSHRFSRIEEMLANGNLDFLVVATPPSSHYSLCTVAIDQGVPLLVEKPVTMSLDEARELANRAVEQGVQIGVTQNYRFKDVVLQARQAVESGELGELRRIDCIYHGGSPLADTTPWKREEITNRLLLYDRAEHFIDLEVAFAGPIESVLGIHVIRHSEVESTLGVHALVEHYSGVVASIDLQLFAGGESTRVELHGSQERIVLKFYPEGYACYRGLITPVHELLTEGARLGDFVWKNIREKLAPHGVTRRAVSHYRLMRKYVEFLRGGEDRCPVSVEDVFPTMELLDRLAEAVY
jgi:predicted dehydrogenase